MVYPIIIPLFTVFHSYLTLTNWCRILSKHISIDIMNENLLLYLEKWKMLVTLDPRNCNFQQVHSNSSMIIRHSHMRLAIEVSPYTTTNISIQIRFIAEAPWKWCSKLFPTFPTSLVPSLLLAMIHSLDPYNCCCQIALFVSWIPLFACL
jgi:hypothetical protein